MDFKYRITYNKYTKKYRIESRKKEHDILKRVLHFMFGEPYKWESYFINTQYDTYKKLNQ